MRNTGKRLLPYAPTGVAISLAATLVGLNLGLYPVIAGGLLAAALCAVAASSP